MRSQAVIDAIAALSPGYDTRRQWPFAEHARRAGGKLVGPFNDLSRTGHAQRIGPDGTFTYAAHNLLLHSVNPAAWSPGGGIYDGVDLGVGGLIDGHLTRRFRSTQNNAGGWYRGLGIVPAGDFTTRAYVARVTGSTGNFLFGTDTAGNTLTSFNPTTGTFSSGPARKGAIAVEGGWEVWATYVSDGTTNYAVVWYGTQQDQFDAAHWAHLGSKRIPYLPTTTAQRFLPRIAYDPKLTGECGPELVDNQAWSVGGGATSITNGGAWSGITAFSYANRNLGIQNGKTYKVVYTVSGYSSGTLVLSVGGFGAGVTIGRNGTFTAYLPSLNSAPSVYIQSNAGTMTMTVVVNSVRECLEYTLTEQYGPELVANGTFDTDTAWSKGGGVTITGGKLVFTGVGVGTGASQTIAAAIGKTYRVRVTVSNWTAGSGLWMQIGTGAQYVFTPTASGSFTLFVTATGTSLQLVSNAAGTALEVDDLSVQEFLGVVPSSPPACLGLQTEGAATHLNGPSSEASNAAWYRGAVTVVDNAAIAPNGQPEADLIIPTTVPAEHYIERNGLSTSNGAYVQAYFVRAAGLSEFSITPVHVGLAPTVSQARFTVSGGAIAPSYIVGAVTASGAERLGNGWYLCWAAYTLSGTVSSHRVRIYAGEYSASFAGNGSSGIYVWHCQPEAGSVPTSPIVNNTTGTALRVSDDWFISGAALDDALGSARATFSIYLEWSCPASPVNDSRILYIGNSAETRRVLVSVSGSSAYLYVADGTTAGFSAVYPGLIVGQINKLCIAVTATEVRGALNGVSFGTALPRTFGGPTHAERLYLLNDPSLTKALASTVRDCRAWPGIAMTIAEAQAMTA